MPELSTSLVRPGDITDAVDADDLADSLLAANLDKIQDKINQRAREELRKQNEAATFRKYEAKAKAYYQRLWDECGESSVGHSYRGIDTQGQTIKVCDTCGCSYQNKEDFRDPYKGTYKEYDNFYSQDLIRQLAKQMQKLDLDAGLIVTATDEDFIGREHELETKNGKPVQKKRRLFR